ncbi:MAG: hypothetical protein KBT03_13605 [Bacteroidales bacterium]|nr:hypothetical protein [Candidatus Scybalousia scybalohippi]
MREDSDIKLVQALDKCENLQKENEELKELLKQVNEHFDWVSYDDSFYVNYPLWREIKKALGIKDKQLEKSVNNDIEELDK